MGIDKPMHKQQREDPYVLITVKKILKNGWLQKRGEWNTEWKRRFFVLYENAQIIKYYQDASKQMHCGQILLNEVHNIRMGKVVNNKFMFELITSKRVWHLSADNFNERKSWCELIRAEMNIQQSNRQENEQQIDAFNAIASNKNVHSAMDSAMNDSNVQKTAMNAYMNGGNDANSNRQLIGALAQNKQVQHAAISVAKDEKVQKAAYQTTKKHAT